MKILQITPAFIPSKFGGVKTVSYNLSKALAKRGHQVSVFTTDADLGYSRLKGVQSTQYIDGIEARYFRNLSNLLTWKCHLFLPIDMNWILNKEISNFDIIHLHDYRTPLNVIVYHYAKKYHIPYILQAHGSVLPFFEKERFKQLFDRLWGNRILRDASKVIAVSKVEKDQYIKKGIPENKIEIIPNGIDISEFETLPERGEFRKKFGIASNEKIVLYLGRLHKSKNLSFLINGFSNLMNHYKDVKLVIVGPDDGFLYILMKQIKQLEIDDHVLFTGPLYKKEKYESYVDADVLVYPGLIEIFGLVPFEAIMCGTPVIVADDCGCGEVIKEAKCGYLVKNGDILNFKKTIINVLENPETNKKLLDSGEEYIQTNLGWDKIVKRVEALYEDCIRNV